jgi:hypothetical protein
MQHVRAKAADQGHPSLPKTPPTHPLPPIVRAGSIGVGGGQRVTTQEFDIFSIVITPQPYHTLPIEGSSREQQGHHNTSSSMCPSFVITWWLSYTAGGRVTLGGAVCLCLPHGNGGAASLVSAIAVWHQVEQQRGSLGAGAGEQRQGKVDAEVEGVTRCCQGSGGATALMGWEVGSGSAAVLVRRWWRGGMTIAVGVPLCCWDGGGTVGA